jgi:hypothetical protein
MSCAKSSVYWPHTRMPQASLKRRRRCGSPKPCPRRIWEDDGSVQVVTLTFASWNHITRWFRQLDALRLAAKTTSRNPAPLSSHG